MGVPSLKIKVYHTPYKTLSIKTFEMLIADPPPDHCSVTISGEKPLLFRHNQILTILKIIKALKELFHQKDLPRCLFVQKVRLALDSSLPFLFKSLIENFRKKCRGFWHSCDLCTRLSSSILTLEMQSDLETLLQVLAPQRLPKASLRFDQPEYLLYPYAVYILEEDAKPIYAPILENIDVKDSIKVHKAIKTLRSHEKRTLDKISIDLPAIIDYRKKLVNEVCELDERLSNYASYSSVGLAKIYPLLVDDRISDFYVDRERTFVYIDHRDYGRCSSTTYVDLKSMNHLLTFARIAADRPFDRSSPSIRSTIKTREFHIRISADIPPLSIEGTSVSVRKFFTKPLSLNTLLSNGTISKEAALYCLDRLKQRKNFTIYGESGSGKTTFAVALDLLAPKEWRKISVETEIAENVPQLSFGSHQVRLLVGTSSEQELKRRISVINSLLQKSPDYIFFGEVLSREDSTALFQLLSAGLKCIHTIHADSAESLLLRWAYQHQIPTQLLGELDVFVNMRKFVLGGRLSRKVFRISEISKDDTCDMPRVVDVFAWDASSASLQPAFNTY